MSLFLDQPFDMIKVAGKKLSENSQGWASEILAQLFNRHAFLGSYQVDFQEEARDDERGYLFGYFHVKQREAMVPQDPRTGAVQRPELAQQEQASAQPGGPPSARIPVIVKDKKLSAFDVFITPDGRFLPLTDTRVMETMSSPELMEAHKVVPGGGATSDNENTPPERTGTSGAGSGQTVKVSSVMGVVVPTLQPHVKLAFLERCCTDPHLRHAMDNNDAFANVVGQVYRDKTAAPEGAELVQKRKMWVPTDAVHFQKTADGIIMTSASGASYEPLSTLIPREDFDLIPDSVLPDVMKTGSVLVAYREPGTEDLQTEFAEIVESGHYKVATAAGDITHGAVITDVVDLAGRDMDGSLFLEVPRRGHTFNTKLAGAPVEGPMDIPVCEPHGTGVFVKVAEDGSLERATLPVKIGFKHTDTVGDVTYAVESSLVGGTKLKLAHGLLNPIRIDENLCALPADWYFVPAGEMRPLMKEAHMAKAASAMPALMRGVQIIHSEGLYAFKGGCGVNELPAEHRQLVKEAEAAVLLGCLGVAEPLTKLATAREKGSAIVYGDNDLTDQKTKMASIRDELADLFTAQAMRAPDLIKVAAAMADEKSVDAILSLGFLTPDNVMAFMENIDVLEQTVGSLAELLISVRLGLSEVKEGAVERGLKGVDETIMGLKALQVRVTGEQTATS